MLVLTGVSLLVTQSIIQTFSRQNTRFLNKSVLNYSLTYLLAFSLGLGWAFVNNTVAPVINNQNLNVNLVVQGKIQGLPSYKTSSFGTEMVKVTLLISHISKLTEESEINSGDNLKREALVELSWYSNKKASLPSLKPGQIWQLPVKLKVNHGLLNPGAFDYERYLFTQAIAAKGYVLHQENFTKMIEDSDGGWRFKLRQQLSHLFKNSSFKGLYLALLIGDKSEITTAQWEMLQKTGTIHLMAISGLHVGIIAMIAFLLFGLLWKLLIRFPVRAISNRVQSIPKIKFSLLGVLVISALYLVISGAAIPTQRAWIMLLVFLSFIWLDRKFQPWSALSLAALLVIIWEPMSVLSTGFWLSFGAVVLIFIALDNSWIKKQSNWHKLWIIQLVLTLGLMPFLAFYYQQIPMTSLFANLVAVPFVSFLALPLLLITTFFQLLSNLVFDGNIVLEWLVATNDFLWQLLWNFFISLQQLNQLFSTDYWLIGKVSIWQLIVLYASWWLILKWKEPLKRPWLNWLLKFSLGLISFWLIVLLVAKHQTKAIEKGNFTLTVFDVGQAQALVVETQNSILIYDTGARWNDRLDGASMAIIPYLKSKKINKLHTLMVSHSDLDHSGGAKRLVEYIDIEHYLSGQPEKLNKIVGKAVFTDCHQQKWSLDGVDFSVISSQPKTLNKTVSDNDHSCVLKVSNQNGSLIIMGDVSVKVERQLLETIPEQLNANILIAGHHGSNSSSSKDWLEKLMPNYVVFSAGYQNRFKFPKEQVVQRVKKIGATPLNTACSGAIAFTITKDEVILNSQYRLENKKLYHNQCVGLKQ